MTVIDDAEADEARRRFAAAPVARLATVTASGRPHVVPVVFALDRDVLWSAVDGKPKTSANLRRVANIRSNPRVSLLVDHYASDWTALWWVRADGTAEVLGAETVEGHRGISQLVAKYEQYQADPPRGPVIVVRVERWTTWSWSGALTSSETLPSQERQKGGGSRDEVPRRAGSRGTR